MASARLGREWDHHRQEHLGGGDDRLTRPVGRSDDPLLDHGDLLQGDLHPQIPPGHHETVGLVQDFLEPAQGFVFFNFGDDGDVRPQVAHELFSLQDILAGAHGGQGDEVHPLGDAEAQVFPVFFGEGRHRQGMHGEIYPHVGA